MVTWRRIFGDAGERFAEKELIRKGYRILARQYRTPVGEIDLIARLGKEIIFVEVKTRRNHVFGYPEEAVTKKKVQSLLSAASSYLRKNHLEDAPWRLDVVAIEWGPPVHFEHIEGIGD
ncbi:MAG: YraN family protein [Patescibacteria group bacterium]|jgi:putative endonuclease